MMQNITLLHKASSFYEAQNYSSALEVIEDILTTDSKNSSAWIIKGNIFYQNQKFSEALSCYQKALETEPENKAALINMANSYYALKNYPQSYTYARQILAKEKDNKNALMTLGNSALELEKYEEAKEALLQVLDSQPNDFWSCNSLSQIYQKTNDNLHAMEYAWQAVEISGGEKEQHINFGYLLYEIGDKKAQEYAQKWLKKYGQNQIVNHMAHAILNHQNLERAEAGFVQEIFDSFADDFEEVLHDLNYSVPNLIENEMEKIYAHATSNIKILDAGCGTGLCGGFLKKYACENGLIGVDISSQMLAKAKAKNCYNQLIQKDLESYLKQSEDIFDLIVFADVLTYFGELKNIIIGCQKSLSRTGRILFSFSTNTVNEENYFLHASGRFLHHPNYIKNLLQKNGFEIENMEEHFLRNEGENKVFGYLVSAIKGA